MKKIITAIAILMVMNPAYSAITSGTGNDSCGSWLSERKFNQAGLSEQWVLGWVSAFDFICMKEKTALNGVNAESIWAYIDKYCRENPLNNVVDGAMALINKTHGKDTLKKCFRD